MSEVKRVSDECVARIARMHDVSHDEITQTITGLALDLIDARAELEAVKARLLTAAGDDLCRLSQEEIKAMSCGAVKIPPKEEFLASCERFHAQVASEVGVNENCLTLAQLIAENARLTVELAHKTATISEMAATCARLQGEIEKLESQLDSLHQP